MVLKVFRDFVRFFLCSKFVLAFLRTFRSALFFLLGSLPKYVLIFFCLTKGPSYGKNVSVFSASLGFSRFRCKESLKHWVLLAWCFLLKSGLLCRTSFSDFFCSRANAFIEELATETQRKGEEHKSALESVKVLPLLPYWWL